MVNSAVKYNLMSASQQENTGENTEEGVAASPFAAVATAKVGEELAVLLREYLRQQTVDPAKKLLRWVLFGLLGALLQLFGMAMLMLAGLRALQTETGSTFAGSLSWLPYVVSIGGVGILLGLSVLAMKKSPSGAPDSEKKGALDDKED